MENLKKFYLIVKSTKKYMVLISIFSLISAADMIIWPYIGRNIINQIVDVISQKTTMESGLRQFTIMTVILISIATIMTVVNSLSNYYQSKLTISIEKIIRIRVFEHLSTLSIAFFEKEKVGKLINKISRGLNRGSNLLQMLANWLLSQIITYFVTIIIFFFINVWLGVLCVIVSVLYLYISRNMSKALEPMHKKINKHWDNVMGHMLETLNNMSLVKSLSMEDREILEFRSKTEKAADMTINRAKTRLKFGISRGSLSSILNITVLILSSYYAFTGKLTPGDILLVQAYIRYIQWPLSNFAWIYDEATESMKSINDIMKVLEEDQTVKDMPGAINIKVKRADIDFRHVYFAYEGGNVIKDFNLKVKAGESIALVGPSGVGKSTIIKLLTRLYDTKKGKVLLDGQDIAKVTQKSLRKAIGIVPQSTILFNDTIGNNIKYGSPRANKKAIIQAAKLANIDGFICKLPKKYNTLVGERGVKLSGGEAQRVSIARAILRNPKILILDEATSSLDSYNEKLVQDALWNLIEGRTTFIIAHRLATVMRANRIIVIENGRIEEEGTHLELIKKKGLYEKLFKLQSGALFAEENKKKVKDETI